MKIQIKKVIKKGPRKLLIINRCNRFIVYHAKLTNTKLRYFEELKRESVKSDELFKGCERNAIKLPAFSSTR